MSRKKQKKRPAAQKRSSDPGVLQETKKTKRMAPAARNLLLLDLVYLAALQMMLSGEMITTRTADLLTLPALAALVLALWLQVRHSTGGPRRPRL